jgi:hypothetical protein
MNPNNGNRPRVQIIHQHQIQNLNHQRRGRPPNPVHNANLGLLLNPVQPHLFVMPAPILMQNRGLNAGIRLQAHQAHLGAGNQAPGAARNPVLVAVGNLVPVAPAPRNLVPVVAAGNPVPGVAAGNPVPGVAAGNLVPVIAAGNAVPVIAAGNPAPGNAANKRLFSDKIRTDFVEKFISSNQNPRQTIREVKILEST